MSYICNRLGMNARRHSISRNARRASERSLCRNLIVIPIATKTILINYLNPIHCSVIFVSIILKK